MQGNLRVILHNATGTASREAGGKDLWERMDFEDGLLLCEITPTMGCFSQHRFGFGFFSFRFLIFFVPLFLRS